MTANAATGLFFSLLFLRLGLQGAGSASDPQAASLLGAAPVRSHAKVVGQLLRFGDGLAAVEARVELLPLELVGGDVSRRGVTPQVVGI
jgi:hypothetical protein